MHLAKKKRPVKPDGCQIANQMILFRLLAHNLGKQLNLIY